MTIIDVRHRQLLTKAVSVVYTVQSTASASTLTSSLASGTAAMTTVLQVSYPAATVAAPTVIAISNPTAAPTTGSPVTSSSNASTSNIIPGAVVGSVVGFVAILALISFHKQRRDKMNKKKIHVDVLEQDKEHGSGLDVAAALKTTIKPVHNSMEEMPFGENDNDVVMAATAERNRIAALVKENLEKTAAEVNHANEATTTSATDIKFPFNARSPFEVEGWYSSKVSSEVIVDDDEDNHHDDDDALVGKSYTTFGCFDHQQY